jgi:hypothetical protein
MQVQWNHSIYFALIFGLYFVLSSISIELRISVIEIWVSSMDWSVLIYLPSNSGHAAIGINTAAGVGNSSIVDMEFDREWASLTNPMSVLFSYFILNK